MAQATTALSWGWLRPLECYAVLGMAVNVGFTSAASLITVPLLQMPDIPARHQAKQWTKFVQVSERIIPPNNAFCVLTLATLGITTYRNNVSSDKLRFFAAAVGLGASVTAYSITVMLPMNKKMIECDHLFQESKADEELVERDFRQLQERWRKLNFVRVALMFSTAVCGVYTLARHGSLASLKGR